MAITRHRKIIVTGIIGIMTNLLLVIHLGLPLIRILAISPKKLLL